MQDPAATIATLFAKRLIRAAVSCGLDDKPLWKLIGVQRDSDDVALIPDANQLAVWEHVMRTLGDPAFPIIYARSMSIDDYGLLGLACKTAPDLAGSLDVLERYLPLFAPALTLGLERTKHATRVVLVRGISSKRLGLRCAAESVLAETLTGMRAIAGRDITPVEVTFAHPAPSDVAAHVELFGVRPRFDAKANVLAFTAATLATPSARGDRALFDYLDAQLVAIERTRGRARVTWRERARAEILRLLPHPPTITGVSRALGLSARSLQRELLGNGCSFRDVLDEVRRELAEAMVVDPQRSLDEIAAATGFENTSSFSRAFRRWTGHAPRRAPPPTARR